jgi:hypothetical protein
MGLTGATVSNPPTFRYMPCRLLDRQREQLQDVLSFVKAGIEAGQQVVIMAGPDCLKDLGRRLGEGGQRPEPLLRSGRLVFLTAPDFIAALSRSDEIPRLLRLQAALIRWVSDWTWMKSSRAGIPTLLNYQRRVHDFVRGLDALSVCTVDSGALERSSLLALLADHRRVAREFPEPPLAKAAAARLT